jgi:uncharacterized sporulation protein YeaH/YhbH (DUF444 family)
MELTTFFRRSFLGRAAVLLALCAAYAAVCPGHLSTSSAGVVARPSGEQGAPDKAEGEGMTPAASQLEAQVNVPEVGPLTLSDKQRRNLLKENFKNMKRDAGELLDLAKTLQEALNKSNENVLSLDIVDKAERIEKLAKRIKATARGF